jgi:ATP/maltotriose-dependent transcriptional regulator MalT
MAIAEEIGDEAGQGYLLSNLGLVAIDRADFKTARTLLQQGLSLAQAHGDAYLASFLCNYLSLVSLKQGHLPQALIEATTSLEIRQTLQMLPMTADNLSVLAAAYLTLEEKDQALAFTNQALAILAEYDNQGPEFPQHDYFICYRVLSAAGQPERARQALQTAYLLVQSRAEKIPDPALRRSFLNKADNRAIVETHRMLEQIKVNKKSPEKL